MITTTHPRYLGTYIIIPIRDSQSGPHRWHYHVRDHDGTGRAIGPSLFESTQLIKALAFARRLIRADKQAREMTLRAEKIAQVEIYHRRKIFEKMS